MLMVINNFHVIRVPIIPTEAHPPLVVNANAVASSSVAAQLFQPIAGRDTQIMQIDSRVDKQ